MGTVDLARFKKSFEGIREFATLIEQASDSMRKRLIDRIDQEDHKFLEKAMRKVVFFEELVFFEEGILAEILASTPPIILAYALREMPPEFRKKINSLMGYRQIGQVKDEEDKMPEKRVPLLVQGAQRQVLKIARQLEGKQSFQFELDDCPRFQKQ